MGVVLIIDFPNEKGPMTPFKNAKMQTEDRTGYTNMNRKLWLLRD